MASTQQKRPDIRGELFPNNLTEGEDNSTFNVIYQAHGFTVPIR